MVLLRSRLAGKQLLFEDGAPWLARFNLLSQARSFRLPQSEVAVYFLSVPEVIRNDGVDISQVKIRVAANNVLGTGAGFKLVNDHVQEDAGIPDAEGSVFVWMQGDRVRVDG
jgi:hypothetical protein